MRNAEEFRNEVDRCLHLKINREDRLRIRLQFNGDKKCYDHTARPTTSNMNKTSKGGPMTLSVWSDSRSRYDVIQRGGIPSGH